MIPLIISIILPVLVFCAWKAWQRRLDIWLPAYLRWAIFSNSDVNATAGGAKHVFFLFVDHYEPGNGGVDEAEMQRRVSAWLAGYPEMARRFADADGRPPQHTWFYPPHYDIRFMHQISSLCFAGLGEVELHLHHENDTADSLRAKLHDCLELYNQYGALTTAEAQPRKMYGFIHGNWALANSAGGKYCGVDSELLVLKETGCYADFTLPSNNECQTRKINSIYYASNKPGRSKSHDTGTDVEVGKQPSGDLLVFQGPLGINWRRKPYPGISNASVTSENPGLRESIDYWVQCGISVKGCPNWIFVKVHTHGAVPRDWKAVFGEKAVDMHTYLNSRYNDGKEFVLHYVTAREAYNLVKAAEAGKGAENPEAFRDFLIPPYANRYVLADCPCILDSFVKGSLVELKPARPGRCQIQFHSFPVRSVKGDLSMLRVECDQSNQKVKITATGRGQVAASLAAPWRLDASIHKGDAIGFMQIGEEIHFDLTDDGLPHAVEFFVVGASGCATAGG